VNSPTTTNKKIEKQKKEKSQKKRENEKFPKIRNKFSKIKTKKEQQQHQQHSISILFLCLDEITMFLHFACVFKRANRRKAFK